MNNNKLEVGQIWIRKEGQDKRFVDEKIQITQINEGSFYYRRWIKSRNEWSGQEKSTWRIGANYRKIEDCMELIDET